jgi:hypothetical protein
MHEIRARRKGRLAGAGRGGRGLHGQQRFREPSYEVTTSENSSNYPVSLPET